MSQALIVPNYGCLPGQGYQSNAGAYGVGSWLSRLNYGSGGFSIVALVNLTGTVYGQATNLIGNAASTTYWGMPLVTFTDPAGPQAGLTNTPPNGWGLWLSSSLIRFHQFNGWNGTVADTGHWFCAINAASGLQDKICGVWAKLCLTKKAEAAAGTDFKLYLNGATAGAWYSTTGTAYAPGDVGKWGRLRFFHAVNNWEQVIAQYCGGGAVWIYDRELTATEAGNATKLVGTAGMIDPLDSTLVGSLVARSYSGVPDWQAIALHPDKMALATTTGKHGPG